MTPISESAMDDLSPPLPANWKTAMDKFFTMKTVPEQYQKLQKELSPGQKASDLVIVEYTRVLKATVPDYPPCPILYVDIMVVKELLKCQGDDYGSVLKGDISKLKGNEKEGFIFWPVHHGDAEHWSLVHIDISRKIVASHDPLPSVGESTTLDAREKIFKYWLQDHVQKEERFQWYQADSSIFEQHTDIQHGNDCSVWVMFLMRLIQTHFSRKLPANEKVWSEVARGVGQRERQRIAATIISGNVDLWTGSTPPTWIR